MSLYHEAAAIVTGPSTHGGSLKSRIFGNKDLKSPPAQVYALVFEASKWSAVLKEVVENAQLLQNERKLTPALSILLTHDLLLAKGGIALPASHGLRSSVEKYRARLQSEFTRTRLRRKCPTLDALKALVDAQLSPAHPRWIRVNAIKSSIDEQLDTTFKGFEVVPTIADVMASASTGKRAICLDGHVPNLIAASPGIDLSKADAYKSGAIILQDKASCFPAYLLDPRPEDGDIIDACSAPGNKTTHLAAILHERGFARGQKILAFEKDRQRAKTLDKMVKTAGSDRVTVVYPGYDFLKTDPHAPEFRNVGALLLDPSCSGSGIVGRDDAPEFHTPAHPHNTTTTTTSSSSSIKSRKRKRQGPATTTTTKAKREKEKEEDDEEALQTRLSALATFQLSILQHALAFPAARKVTYSTCSVHRAENEQVVLAALASDVARQRGWRVLRRAEQVRGMREWPVRGDTAAGREVGDEVGEGCIRAESQGNGADGGDGGDGGDDDEGPFVRDEVTGRIIRDADGIPILKSTGKKAVDLSALMEEESDGNEDGDVVELRFEEVEDGDGPFERDEEGRIIRDADGMPRLKRRKEVDDEEEDEWGGFDD
ncbi:putative methyltransferase NSUN5C [Madurella mycetomatis]|uniref:Methyltransferase NSUN5C n=1 Tax=Madurella mycetomatis TaxID=100816 RepID=A0A175W7D1_9PEZI|nr:putative methyltransferase NSUN5C [Madurella mycetomatis]